MKTRKTLSALTVASVFALAAPFAAPVMAQQAAPTAEVTADELDAFVVAYQSVAALDQEYGQQIDEAEDEAKVQELREEAQVKMAEAVSEAPGIDAERYVQILTIAQNDPDVRADILSKLEQ